MIGIAYSRSDPASLGAAKIVLEELRCRATGKDLYRCEELDVYVIGMDVDVVYMDDLEKFSSVVDTFVVLSRHSSASRIPILSVHTPGNPGPEARYGGKPWELAFSNPVLGWLILRELARLRDEEKLEDVDVVYEATHHGPTSISKPVTFAEIGSSEDRWNDPRMHRVLATAVLEAIRRYLAGGETCIETVGFGGPHYEKIFTSRALKYGECYGHIIAKYVLNDLDGAGLERVARLAIERTLNARKVVLEKLRSDARKVIRKVAEELGLEVETL